MTQDVERTNSARAMNTPVIVILFCVCLAIVSGVAAALVFLHGLEVPL